MNKLKMRLVTLTACILCACGGGHSKSGIGVSVPGDPITALQTVVFDISDFSEVSIEGPFNGSFLQGSEFSVEITLDSDDVDSLEIHKVGQTLNIGFQSGTDVQVETLEVFVVLPALSRVQLAGATNVVFSGFTGSALEVELVGAAVLEGLNIAYDLVSVNATGASQFLMEDVPAIPAVHIFLVGASTATINLMDSAVLTGSLIVASTVFYYGSNIFVSVNTDLTSGVQRLGNTRSQFGT